MHSADYVPHLNQVYVFRGGNGREYLNDLHALDCATFTWTPVRSTGTIPLARANHSSSLLVNTRELVIFGGWNGRERLNDVHILDIDTSTWSKPEIGGELPHPRAGMSLTACQDRLYLFGGSGTSSKCFHDLQILDRKELRWLDVNVVNEEHEIYYPGGGNAARSDAGMYGGGGPTQGFFDNAQHGEMMQLTGQNRQQRSQRLLPMTSAAASMTHHIIMTDESQHGMGGSHHYAANYPLYHANPNDEDSASTITLLGRGPGRRAGHSATVVNRFIYIFGGSCGADYLNDLFVFDTDPPPTPLVNEPTSLQLLQTRLQHFFNESEFSDVTFVVEGKRIYGHKLMLCLVSDCFRAMFTTGFRESTEKEIEIPNCSYEAFYAMMA